MKYLIWFVLCFIIVSWIKRMLTRLSGPNTDRPGVPGRKLPEAMRQCAHCGVHFPASEAVNDVKGSIYCSAEHRTLHGNR